MERRDCTRVGLCAAAAVLARVPAAWAQTLPASPFTRYTRVLLTAAGDPFRPRGLDREAAHLFFYPYTSTLALLVDLGRAVPATVARRTTE